MRLKITSGPTGGFYYRDVGTLVCDAATRAEPETSTQVGDVAMILGDLISMLADKGLLNLEDIRGLASIYHGDKVEVVEDPDA